MIRSRADIPTALRASADCGGLLLDESELGAEFFDVKSGLAREVAQKFISYRTRLAVVVADASARGSDFTALMHEHRAHPVVRYFASHQLARQWLALLPGKKC